MAQLDFNLEMALPRTLVQKQLPYLGWQAPPPMIFMCVMFAAASTVAGLVRLISQPLAMELCKLLSQPVLNHQTGNHHNRSFHPEHLQTAGMLIRWVRLFAWSVGPPFINQIQTGPDFDHTTGTGKYLHVGSFGLSNDLVSYLSLPKIDLSSSSAPVLEFWYHMYGGGIGDLIVLIREHQTTAWDTIQVFSGQQHASSSEPWKLASYNLSAYAADTVEIQFVGTRPTYNPFIEISIDDLYIGDKPTCPSSKLFQVVSSNSTSVLLDWIPDSTNNWQVQYGATGFALGTGTVVNTSSHPTRIGGIGAKHRI